jgi:hypothetical protein
MDSPVIGPSETMAFQGYHDNSGTTPVTDRDAEKPTAATEPSQDATPCPRCGRTLTDPQGLGWCPGCGYCRSLEEDADKAALASPTAPRRPSALGMVEFWDLLRKLPSWLWILVGGVAIVAGASFAANQMLPDNSLPRALWSTLEFGLGLLVLFAAQAWAFLLLAPQNDRLSGKDIVLPVRLWSMTCHRLPETQRQVWLGAWSLVAVLCALCVVGGYTYWYQFYKPKKIADRSLLQAISQAMKREAKDKSMEEAVADLANSQNLTKEKEKAKAEKEDKRPTVQCVILGYTVEEDKARNAEKVSSLVLATVVDGRLKFAGTVRRGITPQASDELLKRLAPLVQANSFLPGLKLPGVVWIKPQLFCEVHQSGSDADGRLQQPRFKDLLTQG